MSLPKLKKPLILASASPRRAKLLREAGIEFEVVISEIEEDKYRNYNLSPTEFTQTLALIKAEDVASRFKNKLVLGADTIVVLEGKIIGKPKDPDEAIQILKTLSGKRHQVITSLAIIDTKTKKKLVRHSITVVHFREVSQNEILNYVKFGEPLDKAGAYAIQEGARSFVEKIE
ncbi:MAG: Maf family protein, partial [bacterium]